MDFVTWYILVAYIFYCDAVSFEEQLSHIIRRRQESSGLYEPVPSRRQSFGHRSVILGAPSMASHLPEADAILPGHTLLRPARDMLKSALKFPHKDPGSGAGVYGNIKNLGIKYDGRNERVAYSGFRRMPNDLFLAIPKPLEHESAKSKYSLSSFMDLSDKSEEYKLDPLRLIKPQRVKRFQGIIIKVRTTKPPRIHKKEKVITENEKNLQKKQNSIVKVLSASYHPDMFKKITNQNTKKKRFGPPGPRPPKQTILKTLLDIDSLRRDRKNEERKANLVNSNILLLPGAESSSEEYHDPESVEKKKEESKEVKGKLEWFWKSKDIYNNIKINQEAPELSDLIPQDQKDDFRQWWFYHQEDFEPFKE